MSECQPPSSPLACCPRAASSPHGRPVRAPSGSRAGIANGRRASGTVLLAAAKAAAPDHADGPYETDAISALARV